MSDSNRGTLYDVLGVNRTATLAEIEAACLKKGSALAERRAIDPEAARLFNEIERAYEMLTREESRREYDADLDLAMSIDLSLGMLGSREEQDP
jgi:curved DNA-binding protein CbpA